ncbi:MAG: hypothetical protein CMO77_07180 [Verrucomicrobiales bacterium]|nr:hypothetical protein [Verrucomicrobiales bacterium]
MAGQLMEDQKLQSAEDSAEPDQTGAESATASEETHEEKVSFSEEQQAKVDEIIGQKTFKGRQRERELQAALESERKARQEAESLIPAETRPDVPPMPNPYDEDFQEKARQRDLAIQRAADYDANEKARRNAEQEQHNRLVQEQAIKLQQIGQDYSKRAVQLGITEPELAQIGDRIKVFGLDEPIAEFILKDEQGPLIAKYLSDNPAELEEISQKDLTTAFSYVVEKIKPKASGLIVKPTDAPDPPELLKGSGMPPSRRGPTGATFE